MGKWGGGRVRAPDASTASRSEGQERVVVRAQAMQCREKSSCLFFLVLFFGLWLPSCRKVRVRQEEDGKAATEEDGRREGQVSQLGHMPTYKLFKTKYKITSKSFPK